jgi:hypothetical protein
MLCHSILLHGLLEPEKEGDIFLRKVCIYQSTLRHDPEDLAPQQDRCEHLKSLTLVCNSLGATVAVLHVFSYHVSRYNKCTQ